MSVTNHDETLRDVNRFESVHPIWKEAASNNGLSTGWLNPSDSLEIRVCKARENGFSVGTIYTRFSTKMQDSTDDQVRTCVTHAAKEKVYCPPEYVFADEGIKGSKVRRFGLHQMMEVLRQRKADVLLVFRVSRLFRQAYQGFKLFQQDVVEEGLRAISVTQGIDTANRESWKLLVQVHGMADEMTLTATAAHVRAGLAGAFHNRFRLGALPIGYRPKEVPNAPLTKRGHVRTVPEVDPQIAILIRQHYQWIREGMSIQEGRRRWIEQEGPVDPRSKGRNISYEAYRRMLSRTMYTGRVQWGRTRSRFSTKRDYVQQLPQPEDQIESYVDENLRIVSDELFFAVQEILAKGKKGPRGPRKSKIPTLWDLTTECFCCADCGERFYVAGTDAQAMQCKQRTLCQNSTAVRRDRSVLAIIEVLGQTLSNEAGLVDEVFEAARVIHTASEGDFDSQVQVKKQAIQKVSHRIDALFDMIGDGSAEEQAETKARLRAERSRRTVLEQELAQLTRLRHQASREITRAEVEHALSVFPETLLKAAQGNLGQDAVRHAYYLFKLLTGGKIAVKGIRRHNRRTKAVEATFELQVGAAIGVALNHAMPGDCPTRTVTLYLRKPPKLERIADRARQLVIDEGHSYLSAAKILTQEGEKVDHGQVWAAIDRWYEMHDLPKPKIKYNNGHHRRSR